MLSGVFRMCQWGAGVCGTEDSQRDPGTKSRLGSGDEAYLLMNVYILMFWNITTLVKLAGIQSTILVQIAGEGDTKAAATFLECSQHDADTPVGIQALS